MPSANPKLYRQLKPALPLYIPLSPLKSRFTRKSAHPSLLLTPTILEMPYPSLFSVYRTLHPEDSEDNPFDVFTVRTHNFKKYSRNSNTEFGPVVYSLNPPFLALREVPDETLTALALNSLLATNLTEAALYAHFAFYLATQFKSRAKPEKFPELELLILKTILANRSTLQKTKEKLTTYCQTQFSTNRTYRPFGPFPEGLEKYMGTLTQSGYFSRKRH